MRIHHSIPTVNWLDFPADGEPAPLLPLQDVLEGIAAAGCRCVGLDDYTVGAFLRERATPADVAALLARLDVTCTDVGILRIGIEGAVALAEWLAELARATQATVCVTALYAPVSSEVMKELETCANVLAEAGARLALEFAPYSPLQTLDEAVSLCGRIGWQRCGLLFDSWHFIRSGAPWESLRALERDQLALVHLDDAPAAGSDDLRQESRFRRLPAGAGTFPMAELVEALQTLGYDGVVSAEVLSAELRAEPPEAGARLLLDSLRAIWPDSKD